MLRKRSVIFSFILLIAASFVALADDNYVPGQLLIKFREGQVVSKRNSGMLTVNEVSFPSSRIMELNSKFKLSKLRSFANKEKKIKKLRDGSSVELPDISNIYLMEIAKDSDVGQAVKEYSADPAIEYASPNYIRKVFAPNDKYYISGEGSADFDPNQWGLYKIWCRPTGSNESGWDYGTGSSSIKVAEVDTGIRYDHVDLASRIDSLEGYDFVNDSPYALDDFGHGTHVAGIIGADTNNGRGVAGVDWNCRIIPIKTFDNSGNGSDSDIIKGLIWAVSKEADVINMSFGGTSDDPALANAIAYCATSDCVLVAAAGNSYSEQISYPASYPHVIGVAATDPDDHKTSYSTWGSWVDVSAPGGDFAGIGFYSHEIFSTAFNYDSNPPGGYDLYTWMAGTSMATPFVSGLASLIRAKYPSLNAVQVEDIIENNSDNIDSLNPSYAGKLGKGRINAAKSLGALIPFLNDPGTIYGVADITGYATGEGFDHYTVEYGLGLNPVSWITAEGVPSHTPVSNGKLATIDTTGINTWIKIRLIINDSQSQEASITVHAGSQDDSLAHNVQYGPNPFNPNKGQILIKYTLDANDEIYLYFFDITGNLIARKFFGHGSDGGRQGINMVYWDGKNDWGETVANGVYLFRVGSGDRTIGKGKIVVLK